LLTRIEKVNYYLIIVYEKVNLKIFFTQQYDNIVSQINHRIGSTKIGRNFSRKRTKARSLKCQGEINPNYINILILDGKSDSAKSVRYTRTNERIVVYNSTHRNKEV